MVRRPRFEPLEDRCLLSFTPATSFPVGTNPLALVTADFNNDGDLDVATTNSGGISVLLGDGAGGFGAAIGTPAGYHPDDFLASLAATDFNEDGNLDLAMAYHGLTLDNGPSGFEWWGVGVLLGNGQGGFAWVPQQFYSHYGTALSMVVGDFNNDAHSDLVVFGEYDSFGYYEHWYGNGHGGFTTLGSIQQSLPYPAKAVGDLNGDGNLDMVWDIDEDYHFISQAGVAIGDFTGEGVPDVITAVSSVKVHVGHGDGSFDDPPITQAANGNLHTSVAVADFNVDGKLDAVTSDWYEGTVSALLGNGDGTLSYIGAFAVGSSPSDVTVCDFNGDGRPDVAVANSGSNNVSVLLNDGSWPVTPLLLGDINRDGQRTAADLQALMTALTDLNTYQSVKNLFGADLLAVADINRDNAVDNADIQALIHLLITNGVGGAGSMTPGGAIAAPSQGTIATVPAADTAIADVDHQGLIKPLASASESGAGGMTSGATAVANQASTIATIPSDPQPTTDTSTKRIKVLDAEIPVGEEAVSQRSTEQRIHPSFSSETLQPSHLKTALIDQAIGSHRERYWRRHSAVATSAPTQLDEFFADWR
jgi:hypothetical protein